MEEKRITDYLFDFQNVDIVPKKRPVTVSLKNPYMSKKGKMVYTNTFTPKESAQCEKLLKELFWKEMFTKEVITGPVEVLMKIFVKVNTGDIDNYIKTVFDSMNGIVFKDDAQVVKINAELKRGAKEGRVIVGVLPHE